MIVQYPISVSARLHRLIDRSELGWSASEGLIGSVLAQVVG